MTTRSPLPAQETANVRQHALDVAIANAPNGAKWDAIIGNAKKFEDYILNGTVPQGEPKPDQK